MNAVDPTQWPATLIVALLLFLLELINNRLEVAELRRTIQAYSDSHDTLWEEYTELKEKYDKQNTDTQDLHQLRQVHRLHACARRNAVQDRRLAEEIVTAETAQQRLVLPHLR